MERSILQHESKYLKATKGVSAYKFIAFSFFFSLFVLPQYCGIPFPLFDFTVLRIMILLMILLIFGDEQSQRQFLNLVSSSTYSKVLIPYMIVLLYTLVLRVDINAFLNPFIEILSLYLLIHIIQNFFGVDTTLKYIRIFLYIICILGLVEAVIQRSPFSFLETISGIYTGRVIRSGYYRIMGPANHALGYGLILVSMIPIICYDSAKKEVNLLSHKTLLFIATMNIFLCGSRSTLGVFILEIILITLACSSQNKRKILLDGFVFVGIVSCLLALFQNTSLGQYVMLQITSVVDEILGTSLSGKYGANLSALNSSSNYREQLKYIFEVDCLNPLVGIGRKKSFFYEINGYFIKSVDNFYIAEYIRYAYPGLISYLVFLLYFGIRMFKICIREKSNLSKALLIGAVSYCVNLLWVDSLQTLKYLYTLFAIFCCLPENIKKIDRQRKSRNYVKSKYIRM